jgi:hypothetical protein
MVLGTHILLGIRAIERTPPCRAVRACAADGVRFLNDLNQRVEMEGQLLMNPGKVLDESGAVAQSPKALQA